MNLLENLIQGKLTIHQEIINKFLAESLQEHQTIKSIVMTIGGGQIKLVSEIRTGENTTANVKLLLALGGYEFNRFNRFIELLVLSPAIISLQGIVIKARLNIEPDPASAARNSRQAELAGLFNYLKVQEERIIVDFNKIPGFNQLLQNKLGFMLKNLEIARLEIDEEMIVIYPAIKFY